jgi:UDP-glucose 4-epimerase
MARVLVTGAGGFIGQALVGALRSRHDVEVLPVYRRDGFDLGDSASFARLPDGITHVAHLGANPSFGAPEDELRRVNVEGTRLLLERTGRGRTLKRFLLASTIAVHDRARLYPRGEPIREVSPTTPTSAYGASKLQAERLAFGSGVPVVVARLAWIYGPGMRTDSHIRQLGLMCRSGHPLTRVEFPGRVSVGFIDDAAEALAELLLRDNLSERVYLVAQHEPVAFGAIFSMFRKLLGRDPRPLAPDWALRPAALLGPLLPMKLRALLEDYYVCDPARLSSEGIHMPTPFEEGLRNSVEAGGWFRN